MTPQTIAAFILTQRQSLASQPHSNYACPTGHPADSSLARRAEPHGDSIDPGADDHRSVAYVNNVDVTNLYLSLSLTLLLCMTLMYDQMTLYIMDLWIWILV